MLGFYDYTVVMTYISLLVSMGGMIFTMNGQYKLAMTRLAVSTL